MRNCRLALVGLVVLIWFTLTVSHTNVSAQSIEERYDSTIEAYNETLNQLERCDESFENFQQFFKNERPPEGAPKEDWDTWATAYRGWVDLYKGCMGDLKKKAAKLRKELDELEKILGVSDSDAGTKAPPPKKPDPAKNKAQGLVKKGNDDLAEWTVNVKYQFRQINDWSRKASDDVKDHGSGRVKIEPSFQYDF